MAGRFSLRLRILHVFFLLSLPIVLAPQSAWGQSAQIAGTVTDTSKAIIPGASVEIVNNATQVKWETKSNGDGRYLAPSLLPGVYQIRVQAPNFETEIIQNLKLNIASKISLDFVLHPGAVSQSVTVDGSGITLNTTDASVSTVIDRQFVENPDRSWLIWIIDLHFRLLGGRVGEILNGIGAGCLLLLCATGALVWWAGLKHWTRGLKVNLHRSWRRVNFDLHSAVGFWTLLVLSMWAFTGVYFVWPKPIESFVNHFSSIASANPPVFAVPPRGDGPWVDLHRMIEQAQQSSPHAKFAGAFFPSSDESALTLLMARGAARNFSQMDYVYFDPATGRQLALWHRGINTTWGGSFIFWLSPLHFGYDWGLAIKILWATLGCALPLLAITGVLMYWNRSLSKKWKRLSRTELQ
jgi:uncharacterized iron-regulated membrane protein